MPKPDVTLAIVTRNRSVTLQRLLSAIITPSWQQPDSIVIYDNSTDGLTELMVNEFDGIVYIKGNKRQHGGANEILRRIETDIISFLDDDVLIQGDYFRYLRQDYAIDHEHHIGSVGGPAISVDSRGKPLQPIHSGTGFNKVYNSPGLILNQDHSPCWIPDEICEVDILRGANMSFRTEVLRQVGGFNESMESSGAWWGEETDPQLSIRDMGYKILYDPRLRVDHYLHHSGGTRSENDLRSSMSKAYGNARNQMYILKKHGLLSICYLTRWILWTTVTGDYGLLHQLGILRRVHSLNDSRESLLAYGVPLTFKFLVLMSLFRGWAVGFVNE